MQQAKSIQETVREATEVEVNKARFNLDEITNRIDRTLAKEPLHIHGAVIELLTTKLKFRHQAMQLAGEEFKHQQMAQMHAAQQKAQQADAAKLKPVIVDQRPSDVVQDSEVESTEAVYA